MLKHELSCRVAALVNYLLRLERELSALMDGGWGSISNAGHRKKWADEAFPPPDTTLVLFAFQNDPFSFQGLCCFP